MILDQSMSEQIYIYGINNFQEVFDWFLGIDVVFQALTLLAVFFLAWGLVSALYTLAKLVLWVVYKVLMLWLILWILVLSFVIKVIYYSFATSKKDFSDVITEISAQAKHLFEKQEEVWSWNDLFPKKGSKEEKKKNYEKYHENKAKIPTLQQKRYEERLNSQKQDLKAQNQAYFCTNCGHQFSEKMLDLLAKQHSTFCEKCGQKFALYEFV